MIGLAPGAWCSCGLEMDCRMHCRSLMGEVHKHKETDPSIPISSNLETESEYGKEFTNHSHTCSLVYKGCRILETSLFLGSKISIPYFRLK